MDFIEKLNNGHPLSKVFTLSRKTLYRDLYIVCARKKEALLHYSEDSITFLSDWFDHIDDFDNFIYTRVYLGEKYNYIYPSGKLISPYWSDEMSKFGQELWPISFNGKYNFIKDGRLLNDSFADGVWADEENENSFIIKESLRNSYPRTDAFFRISSAGKRNFIGNNTKYSSKPIVDLYLSEKSLSEGLRVIKRFSLLSVVDSNGKILASDITKLITYCDWPISESEGMSEGLIGSLFLVRKLSIGNDTILFISFFFATITTPEGYRILSFSSESLLPDAYEEVQVIKYPYIKVKKEGLWNIVDKYGDYSSKDLWFDSIELLNTGNAIVSKGEKSNFLKSNGNVLSSEWFDEITTATEAGKFIIRRGELYNIIDSNLQLLSRQWVDSKEKLPLKEEIDLKKSWFSIYKTRYNLKPYDELWLKNTSGQMIKCFLYRIEEKQISVLLPNHSGVFFTLSKDIMIYGYGFDLTSCRTTMGTFFFNRPDGVTL